LFSREGKGGRLPTGFASSRIDIGFCISNMYKWWANSVWKRALLGGISWPGPAWARCGRRLALGLRLARGGHRRPPVRVACSAQRAPPPRMPFFSFHPSRTCVFASRSYKLVFASFFIFRRRNVLSEVASLVN
jgi:hypothetical protein